MITKEEIIVAVSEVTGISPSEIFSECRYTPITRAKQLATFVLVDIGGMSRPHAGYAVGGKSENGKSRYAKADILLEHDETFRDQYQSVLWKLTSRKAA